MSRRDHSYISQPPERFHWTDIPTGICFMVALLAIGLAIAVNFRPLYYLDISRLNIVEKSGFNAVLIKENYNILIDYCCPFFRGPLEFTIRASESGLSHFAECKQIFNVIYLAGAASLVFVIVSFIIKAKLGELKYLRNCAIITVVLPAIVGIFALIDFDTLFLIFHKITFSNDDWLFDPATDPIINMLPQEFFMQCALIIVGTMLIGVITVLIIYFVAKKNRRVERLLPQKQNYYY